MEEKEAIQLDERIHLIDGFDMGTPERTGTYVIDVMYPFVKTQKLIF